MNNKNFKVIKVDHIAIATKSIESSMKIFSDILGLELTGSEEVEDQKVITDIYQVSNSKLEFLQASSQDSPIARFIDKKGSGIHHIALLVDNLQPALDYLKDQGVQLIDEKPRIGAEGLSIAFIHPKSSVGILVELCEKK